MEQNQSSAPWLRPPNTLCNTDGWRRTRKSTSKITVCSAKKQERLKKHGTQNQSATGFDLETPSAFPSWPRMWPQGQASPTSQGSPTASPTSPSSPLLVVSGSSNQSVTRWPVRARWHQCGRRVWRSREARVTVLMLSLLLVCSSQRDLNTDMTSWLLSWLQWKCLQSSPSAVFYPPPQPMRNLIIFKNVVHLRFGWNVWSFLRKWDETGERGRLRRPPSMNPLLP